MTASINPLSPVDVDEALAQAQALLSDDRPVEALRLLARAIVLFGEDERLLRAAADQWVLLVDQGVLDEWPDAEWPVRERRAFLDTMILQRRCRVTPPIFAHRIASQHSSGIAGHIEHQAKILGPTLAAMFGKGEESSNLLVLLLLLRRYLKTPNDDRISARHLEQFAALRHDDLAIPYSVMFEHDLFTRNVADLASFVCTHRSQILGGQLPIGHLLILLWLVPDAFADLPDNWAADAVAARMALAPASADDLRAARSLLMRFGGDNIASLAERTWPNGPSGLITEIERVAADRAALGGSRSLRSERAARRLEQRPRQALGVARHRIARRAPVLARLRRRPKVAICVSGQLRGFRAGFESWQRTFMPSVDATIFINSWDRVGRAGAEPFRYVLPFQGRHFTDLYREIGIAIGIDALQQRYPTLYTVLAETGRISAAELSSYYRTPHVHLDDEREARFQGLTNPEKMHRKIEACFDMIEASGQEFDLIMRIRPDKPVKLVGFDWRDMLAATRDWPSLYTETALGLHYGALLIGDQFALGGREASRLYARTASRSDAIARFDLLKFPHKLTGHVSLAQMCWLHGIDVRKVPMRFGTLQDPEPLSATEIRDALQVDCAGREHHFDRQLIAANAADLVGKK